MIDAFIAGGRKFEDWSVWTALTTFMQLKVRWRGAAPLARRAAASAPAALTGWHRSQEGFGWGFYKKIFKQYQELEVQPDTDDAKLQEWAVRSSVIVNRNLSPFYRAWGWPLSNATLVAVAGLPKWIGNPMPLPSIQH